MKISPKNQILLVRKHKDFQLDADMAVEESDEDKRLITCEVLSSQEPEYKKGETIICGKYALFQLTLKGEDYYLIHRDDIIGTCEYKE